MDNQKRPLPDDPALEGTGSSGRGYLFLKGIQCMSNKYFTPRTVDFTISLRITNGQIHTGEDLWYE